MQRYNIALLPVGTNLQEIFRETARAYFAEYQDGYFLDAGALAHVTLCQFRAANDQEARDISSASPAKENQELRVGDFRFREGTKEHAGFFWAEFLIEKKSSLLDMQRKCTDHLIAGEFEIFTPAENYSPHITLARMTKMTENLPQISDIIGDRQIIFRPALGIVTENGLMIDELRDVQ